MSEFSFSLRLGARPPLEDAQIKALYDTVTDATITERDGRVFVGIDREAPSFADAVVSAIEDVRRALPAIPVVELQPEVLVFMADIAARRGRTKESVSLLVQGERGPGDFPAPVQVVGGHKLWRWSDVERWFDRYENRAEQEHHDAFVAAVNALLTAQRSLPELHTEERDALRKLDKDKTLTAV